MLFYAMTNSKNDLENWGKGGREKLASCTSTFSVAIDFSISPILR